MEEEEKEEEEKEKEKDERSIVEDFRWVGALDLKTEEIFDRGRVLFRGWKRKGVGSKFTQ